MYNQGLINIKNIVNNMVDTISFVKKSLPLYEEIKPLIKKLQKAKDVLKNINKNNLFNSYKKDEIIKNSNQVLNENKKKDYNSNPQFFL